MIRPERSGGDFLADVHAAHRRSEPFHLWWLGQSGFLLQWRGAHLLFDPYLSDSLTKKYAGTSKPHVRITERVIAPERLDFIDVATSTHNHTDHLDAETLVPLMRANDALQLVIPEANRGFVADRLQCDPSWPVGMTVGSENTVGPFRFMAVPSAHETLAKDEAGRHTHLGYVVQFGPWTVYHSGDTIRYEGMADLLRSFHIDVCMLPVNGRDPAHGVPGNLTGEEAAHLAHDIGVRATIPCHYEMFAFNTASPEPFFEEAARLGLHTVRLAAGGRWSCDLPG